MNELTIDNYLNRLTEFYVKGGEIELAMFEQIVSDTIGERRYNDYHAFKFLHDTVVDIYKSTEKVPAIEDMAQAYILFIQNHQVAQ